MYGLAGERRIPEYELPWLSGYEDSRPVRVGNDAVRQLQLDVYGEVMDSLFVSRRSGLPDKPDMWRMQCALMEYLRTAWRKPDEGLWEVRGPRRHFTHSKVMCWVAADRAVKAIEDHGRDGPLDRWRKLRDDIHRDVCEHGYNTGRQAFVQSYGSTQLDASLLLIPLVGFLPATDPRVAGTVRAVERTLLHEGLVLRYDSARTDDGLPAGEGAFLPCSFWLADNLWLLGRREEARSLFERLLALCRDRHVAVQTIKSVARRRWPDGSQPTHDTWYEPLSDPQDIERAVHWALAREPDVFVNSAGDLRLLGPMLRAAESFESAPHGAEIGALDADARLEPLFVRGFGASA